MKLSDLTVDATNNTINGCFPRLIGILYQNGSGPVSGIATRNQMLAPALDSCQSGDSIRAESSTRARG